MEGQAEKFEKVYVLVVDDRPENVLALKAILSDPSYEVVTAASGAEALKQILRFQFAVILLDVLMPGMDGFEVARLISQRGASQHTPIIFLTAAGTDVASVFKGYSLGAVDYLVKPVDTNIVRAKVAVFADLFRKTEQIRRQEQRLREAERAHSEQVLREREAEYEASFEHAASGIAHLSPDGRWLRVNQALCTILGYERAELLDLKLQDVAHPDELVDQVQALRMILSHDNDTDRAERRYLKKDGSVVWVNTSLSLLRDAGSRPRTLVVVMEDVTERKSAEAGQRVLARASEVLLEAFERSVTLARLCECVVPILADGCILDLSPSETSSESGAAKSNAAASLFVAHMAPAQAAHLRDPQLRSVVSSCIGAEKVAATRQPLLAAELTDELRFTLASSERGLELLRELQLRSLLIVPLVVQDRLLGSITFMITNGAGRHYGQADLVVAEDLAHRVALALENSRLYAAAQSAVRVRDEFLSIASHELRTPITPLHIQLQRMLGVGGRNGFEDMPHDKLRDILQRSSHQVTRLAALVDSLLDVSRLSAGKLTLDMELLDVSALARDVVDRFNDAFHSSGGGLLALDTAPNATCIGDRLRIEQVLTNLLSNAQRYGDGNAVSVKVGFEGDVVKLSVKDHGVGIAPDKQSLIFERFERADAGRNYGGLGLGLYIARQIVDAHGGRILVESSVGHGSVFTVELARAQPHESTTDTFARPKSRPPAPVESRMVLLVEDDADIRDSICDLLQHSGHRVMSACNGLEAIKWLEIAQAPDVILLDLMMPVMDGWQFRSEQQRKASWADIPVIVVSGDSDIQHKAEALHAAGYLKKPTSAEALLDAVATSGLRTGRELRTPSAL